MWWNADKFPWSIPLGCVLRVHVRLHVTFFVVLLSYTFEAVNDGGWAVLRSFLLLGPVLLLTVAVHELAHCLAARAVGGTIDTVVLWPLGGISPLMYCTTSLKAMWVAVAGPLTHIPMVGLWLVLLLPAYHASTGSWRITLTPPQYAGGRHFGRSLCVYAVGLNLALLALSMLVPVYPLALGYILMGRPTVSPRSSAITTTAIAVAVGSLLFVLGCLMPYTLMMLLGLFVLFSAAQLFEAIRDNKLHQHPYFILIRPNHAGGPAAAPAATAAGGGGVGGVGGGVGEEGGGAAVAAAAHPGFKPSAAGPAGAHGPDEEAARAYPAPPSQYYVGNQI